MVLACLKVTSHLQRPKRSIFLLLDLTEFKLPLTEILKSLKAPELLRRTYFQKKFINLEGVIILDPGKIFAATVHVEVRFSCYFHILFTSRS